MFSSAAFYQSLIILWLINFAGTISALDLSTLQTDPYLTPETFARYFENFHFELNEKVQSPDVFLARETGDCDDYATLAADLLKERGYTTKLLVVFMPRNTHVVCYVAETKSYLDFNFRKMPKRLVECGNSIEEIANKVASSFRTQWHCASEFTFEHGVRHFVYTDFPQAAPKTTPDPFSRPWGEAPKKR